ncbi:class I SAM-dependent methyltransferase [Neptuniibacter sp. QD48_55]|uniref:class I SAM-dependent methyltransferase n=1 Tax=Neptuniibacter sp. QD48_55 TaxID=3398212 RepID=UPI0039F63D11
MTEVNKHYSQAFDGDQIIRQLHLSYPQGPTAFQLAPIDQLHIGGIKASMKLLQQIKLCRPNRVLDIGSGLGGLMRLIESKLEINVIGLDITHEFNQTHQQISQLLPSFDAPKLITSDAQQLPFCSDSFDLIIFQHSLLNIPNSQQALAECRRVLKPQGRLLLHEVIQGPNTEAMQFPVPWAREPSNSHLITQSELVSLLEQAGFKIQSYDDWSQEALAWRQKQLSKEQQSKSQTAAVSPAMILGPEFKKMSSNVVKNLELDAIRIIELVAQADCS